MPDPDLDVVKLKRKLRDTLKLIDIPILIGHVDEKSRITESVMSLRKILKETYFNISLLDYFS
jgi:PII-like signaling protein